MNADYRNEFGEYVRCRYIRSNVQGTKVLIVLDGEWGWCSPHLVELDDGVEL